MRVAVKIELSKADRKCLEDPGREAWWSMTRARPTVSCGSRAAWSRAWPSR